MDRKIELLIEYLYTFSDTITKTEVQKILRRLKDCGINEIIVGDKKYILTNMISKSIKGAC